MKSSEREFFTEGADNPTTGVVQHELGLAQRLTHDLRDPASQQSARLFDRRFKGRENIDRLVFNAADSSLTRGRLAIRALSAFNATLSRPRTSPSRFRCRNLRLITRTPQQRRLGNANILAFTLMRRRRWQRIRGLSH